MEEGVARLANGECDRNATSWCDGTRKGYDKCELGELVTGDRRTLDRSIDRERAAYGMDTFYTCTEWLAHRKSSAMKCLYSEWAVSGSSTLPTQLLKSGIQNKSMKDGKTKTKCASLALLFVDSASAERDVMSYIRSCSPRAMRSLTTSQMSYRCPPALPPTPQKKTKTKTETKTKNNNLPLRL